MKGRQEKKREAVDQQAREFFSEWEDASGRVNWQLEYLLIKATKINLSQRFG